MRRVLTVIGLILTIGISQNVVHASTFHSVGLLAFSAQAQADHILLTWQTASELDSAGFLIYRSVDDGGYTAVTQTLIPAVGSPTVGANYEFADSEAPDEGQLQYQLTEVQLNGSETVLDSVTVTVAPQSEPIQGATMPPPPNTPTPAVQQSVEPVNTAVAQPTSIAQLRQNQTTVQNQPAQEVVIDKESERSDVTAVNQNQPVILQQETPEAYPPPVEETEQPVNYDVATPTLAVPTFTPEGIEYVPPPTLTPLPSSEEEAANDNVTIVGDNVDTLSNTPQPESAAIMLPPTQGRLYLWLGFLTALLVFGVSIFIATRIFTRRSQ